MCWSSNTYDKNRVNFLTFIFFLGGREMYQRLSYTTLEYFNKVNATIFDKYGAEITVNA